MAHLISEEMVLALINSEEDFPVDFDDAWKWLGYSQSQKCKTKLFNNFDKDIDYQIISPKRRKTSSGGRPSQHIVLTIDCFKSLGMMAGTDQGKKVRRYFLNCEKKAKEALKKAQEKPRYGLQAYLNRINQLRTSVRQMPEGYWNILEGGAKLLIHVEGTLGIEVNEYDLLDSSIGKRWAAFREGKEWAGEVKKYVYYFPDNNGDHRGVVTPKCYPNSEYFIFQKWLRDVYEVEFLPPYLKKKYGYLVKV